MSDVGRLLLVCRSGSDSLERFQGYEKRADESKENHLKIREILGNKRTQVSQVVQVRAAQKLQKQYALKGQKLLAQGNALGILAVSKAPCKGKSLIMCVIF